MPHISQIFDFIELPQCGQSFFTVLFELLPVIIFVNLSFENVFIYDIIVIINYIALYWRINMIRFAVEKDIPKIMDLLSQVCLVHRNGRPDIFRVGTKYSTVQLKELLRDKTRPILVSVDHDDNVMGYCFCIFQQHINDSVLTDIKTLYIDDLCVDENLRGKHIGKELYEAAVKFAKTSECYNLTLNVWNCNPSALRFYEKMGLLPQKIYMEKIL